MFKIKKSHCRVRFRLIKSVSNSIYNNNQINNNVNYFYQILKRIKSKIIQIKSRYLSNITVRLFIL